MSGEVRTGMEHIIRKTTPRRRSALSSRCILSPTKRKKLDFLEATSVKNVFLDIKKRMSLRDKQLRRMIYLAVCVKKKLEKHSVNKHLGVSWNFLSKGQDSRKKRKAAIPEDTVESVIQFYNRCDIAREMPTPRMVPKKTMIPNNAVSIQCFCSTNRKTPQSKLVSAHSRNYVRRMFLCNTKECNAYASTALMWISS